MISLYSLIWTVVISCPLILLIFVLRRKSTYLMKYGVTFICILYAFCAVRMLIPIEVPAHQKVICDPYVYSYIMRAYALLDKAVKHKIVSAIIIVWIIGSIVTAVYYWITVGKRLINLRKTCYKGDGRAERIFKERDTYLEKRKDGTYIFHYGKYSQEVSEDEIKEGLYREYLIIEEK